METKEQEERGCEHIRRHCWKNDDSSIDLICWDCNWILQGDGKGNLIKVKESLHPTKDTKEEYRLGGSSLTHLPDTKEDTFNWKEEFEKAWKDSHKYLFNFSGAIDSFPIKSFIEKVYQQAREEVINKLEKARDDDSCECDNCHRTRKFIKSNKNPL